MTKQKQQLSINLDEIKNPHPEVLRAYKEAKAEDLHFMHIPAYVNEERAFLHSKSSNTPIRHLITHLYRKQTSGVKNTATLGKSYLLRIILGMTFSIFVLWVGTNYQ